MRLERQVAVRHVVGSSPYRRRSAIVSTQVLLWRTILIATLGFGLYVAFAPRYMREDRVSQADETRIGVRTLAFEAFPQWASVHHMDSCPASLNELLPYATQASMLDAWGRPLEMKCGPWIRGVYVRSAGEDGRFDTPDDISSND